jgi:hypothetical protein
MKEQATKKHRGSCHCGAVTFEVEVDATKGGRCNCSVCTKVSQTSAIVPPSALTVLTGEDRLTAYEWGGKISKRYFCPVCGVTCFGRGHLAELGGDYASVNLLALDDVDPTTIELTYWDGRHNNWDAGPRATPWPIHKPS